MNHSSLLRLLGVLFGGLLILGFVLGSVGLSQLDPGLVVQRPTRRVQIPTPTLYPTLAPVTVQPSPTADTTPGAPTATPQEELCPPPEGWQPYEVRVGDSIYTLAWTAQITANRLAQANCLTSMTLQPGDIIYLPPIAFGPPATEEIEPCGPPPHWRITYVQPGDTLYSLSVRYGTTIEAIRQANCMRVGDTLYAGQALYLPPEIVVWPTNTPTQAPTWTPTPSPSSHAIALRDTDDRPSHLDPDAHRAHHADANLNADRHAAHHRHGNTVTPTPGTPTRTPSPTPTGTIFLTPDAHARHPDAVTYAHAHTNATPTFSPTVTPSTPTQTPTPTATPSPTPTLTPSATP